MAKKKNSFSGSLGFVLAAAGSAVGVGNIWRFPYLCAKDGGGLFLLVYLVLVATFGFVLLTTDVAIGRRTKENALRAFGTLHPKWKFVGYLTFLVPMLIMTYYSVIGGWITKYFFEYLKTSGRDVAEDGYFTSFITEKNAPLIFTGIFLALTIWIVYRGVEKGIEKFSCFIMPGLILLVIGIAIFSLTLSYTDADGTVRTGIQGFLVYVRPDVTGLTVKGFLEVLLDAVFQHFRLADIDDLILRAVHDIDARERRQLLELLPDIKLRIISHRFLRLAASGPMSASGTYVPILTVFSLPQM